MPWTISSSSSVYAPDLDKFIFDVVRVRRISRKIFNTVGCGPGIYSRFICFCKEMLKCISNLAEISIAFIACKFVKCNWQIVVVVGVQALWVSLNMAGYKFEVGFPMITVFPIHLFQDKSPESLNVTLICFFEHPMVFLQIYVLAQTTPIEEKTHTNSLSSRKKAGRNSSSLQLMLCEKRL